MPPKSDLFKHVIEKSEADQHGNRDMECVYDQHQFRGGANRILHHLAGTAGVSGVAACDPEKVPADLREKLRARIKQEAYEREKKTKLAGIKRASSDSEVEVLQPRKKDGNIKSLFSKDSKREVDQSIARFFYATGTSFNRISSPYFDEMLAAVARYGPGYKKPNRNQLRDTLLCAERAKVKSDLQTAFLDCVPATGATMGSDGWSSTDNRPLLNVVMVTPKGACFRTSIDTSGATKDADYIADTLEVAIKDAGAQDIVQVVMDGASVCISAGQLLEERFPHITFTRCTAHTLDLLLEDICKLPWAKEIKEKAMTIVHFITNHHKSLALFREQSEAHSKGLQLKKPADTRFAYVASVADRMLAVKEALQNLLLSAEYKTWADKPKYRDKADEIYDLINNRAFWKSLEQFSQICLPIVTFLREVDGDRPFAGKVYNRFSNLMDHIKELKGVPQDRIDELLPLVEHRWNMAYSDMHGAGYALDPEYIDYDFNSIDEVMTSLDNMLVKLLGEDDAATASLQHSKYRNKEGRMGTPVALANASKMPAWKWWQQYGSGVPELQKAAVKILAQCSSACSCERNWSTYSFIHSKSRNRLRPDRARDLVYVFSNLRLLMQISDEEYEEEFPDWASDEEE